MSIGLLSEVCAMLRRRVLAQDPGLDEREVRKQVASCLYRTDRGALELLSLLDP